MTTLVAMLPRSSRSALARAMSAFGMLICLVVGWFALQVTLNAQGLEIRSFEMPKWVLYAPLPLGFFLLAIEFLRHTLAGYALRRRGNRVLRPAARSVSWYEAAALMIGCAMGLMALGLPVAFSFIATDVIGAFVFMGGVRGLEQVASNMSASVSSFLLVPVPLFILMGDLMVHTGLAGRMMDGFDKLIGRVPGRLCYVSVGAGTVFGALSGSAMASTAMLGSTLVPEMIRRGYKKHMAMGPILGAGGLDILIPPSAIAVLLGSIAQIDIGRLLIAGIVPALILAVMYVFVIAAQLKIDPSAAPPYDLEPTPWREKLISVASTSRRWVS